MGKYMAKIYGFFLGMMMGISLMWISFKGKYMPKKMAHVTHV